MRFLSGSDLDPVLFRRRIHDPVCLTGEVRIRFFLEGRILVILAVSFGSDPDLFVSEGRI